MRPIVPKRSQIQLIIIKNMATKTDISVTDKLKNLYTLQTIDSKIDEIEIFRGELPMEVKDLEDEIVGLETRIGKLKNSLEEVTKVVVTHKGNIKDSEGLIEKYEKQLENVKNNREFEALTKEIELQKLEIQLSQKKIGEAEKNVDAKKEVYDTAVAALKERQNDLDIKKVELDKIIEKTEKEERSLKKKSETAKKKIEERLLKSYNRIRSNYKNGLAVVNIERDSCGGCFNRIPPQIQLEIDLRRKIIACEHCGRVLVDDNIMNAK